MAKTSSTVTDSTLRKNVFSALNIANIDGFHKVNDRQYGCIMTDANGIERYIRVGAIVAEVREDMTARELMAQEVQKYNDSVAKAAARKAEAQAKAERDKAARAAKQKAE